MRKLLFMGLLGVCWGHTAWAQQGAYAGFSLQLGVPMGDFTENTQAVGGGINMSYYHTILPAKTKKTLWIGGNLGYMLYGAYNRRVSPTLSVLDAGGNAITAAPFVFDVTNSNSVLNGNVALRFQLPFKRVRPYAEGLVGMHYLYTRTSIYDASAGRRFITDNDQESNLIPPRTSVHTIVPQYGFGGGFLVKIGEHINLDLRGAYLMGGKAAYFEKSQAADWRVSYAGNSASYTTNSKLELNTDGTLKKWDTDLFLINFGFSFDM